MPYRAAAFLFVTTLAASAAAVPPPIELTRHRGNLGDLALSSRRVNVRPDFGRPLLQMIPMAAVGATEVKAVRSDITFDPVGGAVSAKLEIDLAAAASAVAGFAFYVDDGLTVSAATAPGTTVVHDSQLYAPYRIVSMGFDPPIAAGTTRTISVSYGGQLNCAESSGQKNCSFGGEMSFMLEGSVMPALIDAAGFGGYNIWGASRELTLRLPSGTDVVATGELASQSDDGTTLVQRWDTPGYQSIGGYLAVMGDFDKTTSPGTSVATDVVALSSAPVWTPEMTTWMQTILPFVDAQTGMKLPYQQLNVIKLPSGLGFPGTAGHAITLLSEDYSGHGPRYFEETLAHENAHQWWGVLVSPLDTTVTRWLTEGLATLSQVDYTAAQRIPVAEREAYLARRYREHRVLVRYHTSYDSFPPLVVSNANQTPNQQPTYTIWAYIRSAAILESFRAAIGDEAFAQALRDYATKCAMARCDTSDFRAALEGASGQDFGSVFTGWVYETHHPRLIVGFSQEPVAEGQRVTLELSGEQIIETPLEIWIELEDGKLERRRIVVSPSATTHELVVPGRARAVRPNPRHDAVVWSRSAQDGDFDFDREVDGFDLIQCARAIGRSSDFTGAAQEGILGVDLEFDPRCDIDESGTIDDSDLTPTNAAFGTVKEQG